MVFQEVTISNISPFMPEMPVKKLFMVQWKVNIKHCSAKHVLEFATPSLQQNILTNYMNASQALDCTKASCLLAHNSYRRSSRRTTILRFLCTSLYIRREFSSPHVRRPANSIVIRLTRAHSCTDSHQPMSMSEAG